MLVFGILLISAVSWSLFDVARKNIASRYNVFEALLFITLFQTPIYVIQALIKGSSFFVNEYFLVGLIGVGLNFLANSLFIISVSIAPISETVPLLSLTPVFSAIVAMFFLHEDLTLYKWFGILMIISGAFILNGVPSLKTKKGPFLMMLVALFWGSMVVVDKYSISIVDPSVHLFYQCMGIALLCALVLIYKKKKVKIQKGDYKHFAFATLSAFGAMYAQVIAFKYIYVSFAEAIKRALNLVITLFFGRIFFAEKITMRKVVAIMIMALGIYVLMNK